MTYIRLQHLTANAAWVFVFGGEQLLRLEDAPMFFASRRDAVTAARALGFTVAPNGATSAPAREQV